MFEGGRPSGVRGGLSTVVTVVTLQMMALAIAASLWSVQRQFLEQERFHRELAQRGAQSAAREIITLLGEMRRGIGLFAAEHRTELAELAGNPGNLALKGQLDARLLQHFPDHYAFTLARNDGELLVDDFGEAVGDLCRRDIYSFSTEGRSWPIIHPGPGQYHFDLMAPIGDDSQIFFLSFRPDRLASVLRAAELPGQSFMLVRRDRPDLIEVSALGGRDRLGEAVGIDSGGRERIDHLGARAPVPDTGWEVVVLPSDGLHRGLHRNRLLAGATAVALILVSGGSIIAATLIGERRRRRYDEQLRLAAAVFDSAQEGIAITDLDGRIVAVNRAFSTITEYRPDEVVGRNTSVLKSDRHDEAFYRNMWHDLRMNGFWQGEIWDRRKSGEVYLEWLTIRSVRDEAGQTVNYVAVYTDLGRINHARSELEQMAHYDPLTGLPNRLLFYSRLDHAIERARRKEGLLAVMFLDLDRFKEVNDTLGHAAGDEVLQLAAGRFAGRLRESDTLGRLGGDEFALILEELDTRAEAEQVASDLVSLLIPPLALADGREASVGVSIGIAFYPGDGDTGEQVLAQADTALYRAKGEGRNTYRSSGA